MVHFRVFRAAAFGPQPLPGAAVTYFSFTVVKGFQRSFACCPRNRG
jgi:hypothetical protein